MRKRTIKNCCDEIFWYLLYFLPIIIAIVSVFAYGGDWYSFWYETDGDLTAIPFIGTLSSILSEFGFGAQGIIYDTLLDIFGTAGLLGFVQDPSPILVYFQYFITVYLIHLCVDFILFIPRLCHKWLNAFTRSEE